ncbi:TetR/AcrR family transcriptional regulator [Williamsia sp. MIQD14]|uniref:TetR/AcrR family transcriptional regulator n=1 Tax=Williamsia sp. MIQD14 TaxID=3425703 RepID=UPI003DA0C7DC
MSPEDRRRQLLGLGLRMLVERPIHELSIDAVAAEAGISRGLLFHYFPSKSAFYDAVIDAATRRVLRTTAPDPDATAEAAPTQFVRRFLEQIERRRDFYLALVYGTASVALGGDRVVSLRLTFARQIAESIGAPESEIPLIHAWTAYVEDRALQWSDPAAPDRVTIDDEVAHCVAALEALRNVTTQERDDSSRAG